MLCIRLAVQGDQLACRESFSESRELLSHNCSLAGCTRGLGRHQTGSARQVEAMDVYLVPFIKPPPPKTPEGEIGAQRAPGLESWRSHSRDVNKPSWIRSVSTTQWLAAFVLSHGLQGAWIASGGVTLQEVI